MRTSLCITLHPIRPCKGRAASSCSGLRTRKSRGLPHKSLKRPADCVRLEPLRRTDRGGVRGNVRRSENSLPGDGLSRAAKTRQEKEEAMKTRRLEVPKWSAADRARHKAIRDELEHRPAQEELQGQRRLRRPDQKRRLLSRSQLR